MHGRIICHLNAASTVRPPFELKEKLDEEKKEEDEIRKKQGRRRKEQVE